ncbi:MAG: hypothetical protein KDA24_24045 [Deltaproteobacteria bacterium]|nr:hypothetical protein [Deltaproteobacteria bacterium]
MRPLLLLLLALAPTLASAAPRNGAPALSAEEVDARGYGWLFADKQPMARTGATFQTWSMTLVLDEIETLERRFDFALVFDRPSELRPTPTSVPIVVIDDSLGEWCEAKVSGLEVTLGDAMPGFDHLGAPKTCSVTVPEGLLKRGGVLRGSLVAHRPRVERVEDRFAYALPIQPLAHGADRVELAVEYSAETPPRVRPQGWSVELGRQVVVGDRERIDVALLGVNPLPVGAGVRTVVGRVPTVLIDSGEGWDDVAAIHAAFYDSAARAEGAVIPLAGAVFAQPDVPSAAMEAVIRALDGTKLNPEGGTGGAWRLPVSAISTVEDGSGTAADRAALLVSLLRTADVKAEILLLSSAPIPVGPDEPLPLLNRTLVVVPKGAPDGGDLYVDPTKGSLWLGSLPESLLGRDALLLSRSGARWVRTPESPPRRNWVLNASERVDGDFDVTVRGELSGGPAARMREWLVAGRTEDSRPAADLAWLGGSWAESLEPRFHSPDGARLVVRAQGVVPREVALPDGKLAPPRTPPAAPEPELQRWPYARDAEPLAVELLESWTFRGILSGPPPPPGDKVTPFWSVASEGAWSGPVFTRRSALRFTARELPRDAAVEVDRFSVFVGRLLADVLAPGAAPE